MLFFYHHCQMDQSKVCTVETSYLRSMNEIPYETMCKWREEWSGGMGGKKHSEPVWSH